MWSSQAFFAFLIAFILIGLAGWFGRQSLRRLLHPDPLDADRGFHVRQAWLRLVGCALMGVIAVMVAGASLGGMEERARELGERTARASDEGREPELSAADRAFRAFYGWYWGGVGLLLLGIFLLAAADLWGIRRYGRRQLRQLQSDRRAMLEGQIARYRSERNGH